MPPVPNAGADRGAARDRQRVAGLAIERLTFADLPQVLAIERRSYSAPWSLAMFVLETTKAGGLSVAARAPSPASGADEALASPQLVGYAIVSRYDDAYHLMNVCTEPNRRREGIARAVLDHVIAAAGGPEARITLEVRPSNAGARALYAALGFVAVGTRRRYYRDDGEDALIMWRTAATLEGRTDDVPGVESTRGAARDGVGVGGPVPPDAPVAAASARRRR